MMAPPDKPLSGAPEAETARRYRAIWISDIHLGTRGCKAGFLLDFLRETESETLYLVGDIVDGWRLKRSWYWPQLHNDVAEAAAKRGVDGVVCGHIHHAEIREIAGVTYCNDGDWVESCTALVEHFDGRLEILKWVEDQAEFLKPARQRESPLSPADR